MSAALDEVLALALAYLEAAEARQNTGRHEPYTHHARREAEMRRAQLRLLAALETHRALLEASASRYAKSTEEVAK